MACMKRLLLLATLLTSIPALAGDPTAWFRKLDRNRDGFLDRKELAGQRGVLAAFDQADENGDGKLDPDEFIKAEAIAKDMKRGVRRAGPSPEAKEPVKKEPAG